jgi:hypothetical protein
MVYGLMRDPEQGGSTLPRVTRYEAHHSSPPGPPKAEKWRSGRARRSETRVHRQRPNRRRLRAVPCAAALLGMAAVAAR